MRYAAPEYPRDGGPRLGDGLPHQIELPVLGISVRFAADAPEIIDIVEETFGDWRALAGRRDLPAAAPVSVRLVQRAGSEGSAAPSPVEYRMPDPGRLVLTTPGSVAVADVSRRDAVAYVTTALVADRPHFRYSVLEAVTRFILSHLDRQPLHAAAVVREGVALLLAGPSGSGKSSVTYAALEAGFQLLAEDMVYLQLQPRLRVWGIPGAVLLPVDVQDRLASVGSDARPLLANGKRKVEVPTRTGARRVVQPFEGARVCVLRRGAGPCSMTRLQPAQVEAALTTSFEPGFDLFAATIGSAVRVLARDGGWLLTLSADPTETVPFLERMTAQDFAVP